MRRTQRQVMPVDARYICSHKLRFNVPLIRAASMYVIELERKLFMIWIS